MKPGTNMVSLIGIILACLPVLSNGNTTSYSTRSCQHIDKYDSCGSWKDKYCTDLKWGDWMAENCAKSCKCVEVRPIDDAFCKIAVDRSKEPSTMKIQMKGRPTATGEIDETDRYVHVGWVNFPDDKLYQFWYYAAEGFIYWGDDKGNTANIWRPTVSGPCVVDGGWTSWSICSNTCEDGALQTRTCTNPTPANGGKDCSGSSSRKCNQNIPCPLWRDDGRCGKNYPLLTGKPGQCDPTADANRKGPCCSRGGYCGNTNAHCLCSSCEIYADKQLFLLENDENTWPLGSKALLFGPTDNFERINFNDKVSSVYAGKGDWELYSDKYYEGHRFIVEGEWGSVVNVDRNDYYSSARPICQSYDNSEVELEVREHSSFRGDKKKYNKEEEDLADWGDKISSVRAIKGDWELYQHINYEGRREVVKEGKSISQVKHNDQYSSLRPICETYTPKCKPIRIEVLGNGNKKYVGTQILGASSAFSCSGPAHSTLKLTDVDSVTESISVGFSESKEINWSVGATVSLSVSGTWGTEIAKKSIELTVSLSTTYGESYTVTNSKTETFTSGSQQLVGQSVTYDTPGGAIVFGTVDKYTIDNSDVPVNIHVECNGKSKIIKSTMTLKSTFFKSAHFGHFNEKSTKENCDKPGYYSRIDSCIQNVKSKYHNRIGEKEKMRKQFYNCFI